LTEASAVTGPAAGPPPTARVDAHHHVWDLAVRDQPWTAGLAPLRRSFGIADLRPALQRGNVTATVLVQTITVPEETPEMLALAADEPLIAGVVGWAALDSPAIADTVAELRELPGGRALAGIRHQVQEEPDPRWLCRPAVRGGLAAVGAAGLAYDLLVTAGQLPAAVETVRALPEVRFVLDHAGNPPVDQTAAANWRRDVLELSRAENVTVKLSGLVTRGYPDPVPPDLLRSWAQTLLDGFGPGRMMFGSDWPVCTLTSSYDEVVASAVSALADLSAAERQSVFAGTATRFYRLAR
jgi:L-fuconolactonase